MPRDTQENAHYIVSISKDSELLRIIKKDAKDCNLSVAKLMLVRLKDCYAGHLATAKPAVKQEPLGHDRHKKHPNQSLVNLHLMRAEEAGTPATLTLPQWQATITYFEYKCAYCHTQTYQVLEHYMPIKLSGGTSADNCIPSCKTCNTRKGNKHPDQFEHLFPTENIQRIKKYFASLVIIKKEGQNPQ